MRIRLLILLCSLLMSHTRVVMAVEIPIHSNGEPNFSILISKDPSPSQLFSAEELAGYLEKISGSKFVISEMSVKKMPAIRLEVTTSSPADGYSIVLDDKDIVLNGNSDRALLYAVYDFLGQLGCLWWAPNYNYYNGHAEMIPQNRELYFNYKGKITEQPALEYRKLDVAGARASTTENLIRLVEWMPKARYNTLRFAMDSPGGSKPKWNKWRNEISREMKKRGLIIEVGGHGYHYFLNQDMHKGQLFKEHSDWFGKDSLCRYTPSNRLVFNTENPEAVSFFITNVIDYLKAHPEIAIFDLWPPDVGRWADCAEWNEYGTPADRQTHLTNQVNAAIKNAGLKVKTEMIAYSHTLLPPENEKPDEDILLEICPINQSFEYQINDPKSLNNQEYATAIASWRKVFSGSITFYSYYRKQAWRSLANIIPHYLQTDMQWIAGVPLNGISCYAEQGDWFSYELNHYTLARLAWNPDVNLDVILNTYFKNRYGKYWQSIEKIYENIEEIVPVYGSIPFSSLKSKEKISIAQKTIARGIQQVEEAVSSTPDKLVSANLSRLLLVLHYLDMDLRLQYALAANENMEELYCQIEELVLFLETNSNKGVFILTGNNDFARFTKKYGLTHQSLLD